MYKMNPSIFTLLTTKHGPMILSLNDKFQGKGLFAQMKLCSENITSESEINAIKNILKLKRKENGKVVALDIGANFGVFTLEMSNYMKDWGQVLSFEAQEKIYYALCGNVALNNCLNVIVKNLAVGSNTGYIEIPKLNYYRPTNLGSFSIKKEYNMQNIGQNLDYEKNLKKIKSVKLDDITFKNLDFIKLDVEGMEIEVIEGSEKILNKFKPVLLVDFRKIDRDILYKYMKNLNYVGLTTAGNQPDLDILFFHKEDPCLEQFLKENPKCYKIF